MAAGYWEGREAARQAAYDRTASEAVATTQKAMRRSLMAIKRRMEDILRVYMQRHKLPREQALKLLASPAGDTVRAALQQEIARVTDPEARRFLQARIEASAYSARLTNAQAMRDSITLDVANVAEVQRGAVEKAMMDTAVDGCDRMMFDIQRNLGRLFPYAQMNAGRAQEILKQRWLGGNYSARIWSNADQLADSLQTCVMENMMGGKTSDQTYHDILDLCGQDMRKANRLIRTETSYAANQGEKYAYQAAGIERYEFVAALEARTCERCGGLDGQTFPVKSARVGYNYPPMHPFCRCTTCPYDEDMQALLTDGDTRWARDPVTGEEVQVPMTMTYSEWRKAQNDRYGADTVETQRKKLYNVKADQKQLKAYRAVIGKNRFTKDVDAFQTMKYGGGDTYRLVGLDYRRQNALKKDPSLALANADRATAADAKFTRYLFNPENKDGWAKGVAFTSRLGYDISNWQELQKEILTSAQKYPATVGETNEHGTKYTQKMVLYGKKEKPANVITGWKCKDEKTWMTTVYVKEAREDD